MVSLFEIDKYSIQKFDTCSHTYVLARGALCTVKSCLVVRKCDVPVYSRGSMYESVICRTYSLSFGQYYVVTKSLSLPLLSRFLPARDKVEIPALGTTSADSWSPSMHPSANASPCSSSSYVGSVDISKPIARAALRELAISDSSRPSTSSRASACSSASFACNN